MMTSLQKWRVKQIIIFGCAGLLLAGMIFWNIRRSPPEEQIAADFTAAVANRDWRNMDEAQRREFRGQWDRFSPENRKQVMYGLARRELDRFREQAAGVTPEQNQEVRERLESPAGQEAVKNVLGFYQSELMFNK